jgi:hypothetical protein
VAKSAAWPENGSPNPATVRGQQMQMQMQRPGADHEGGSRKFSLKNTTDGSSSPLQLRKAAVPLRRELLPFGISNLQQGGTSSRTRPIVFC